jgi:hypothetical protein
MPGTSLPPLVPERLQHRTVVVSAYNMLLRLEATILAENDHTTNRVGKSKGDVDLMYCRIIGHFFHHVPSDRGLSNLVREAGSTGENRQKLLDLGKLYYDHTFRLCEFILTVFCSFLRFDETSVRFAKGRTSFAISSPFSLIIRYPGRHDQEHA